MIFRISNNINVHKINILSAMIKKNFTKKNTIVDGMVIISRINNLYYEYVL